MAFLGNYIEGGTHLTFRVGKINVQVQDKVEGYKREEPINWTDEMDSDLVEEAFRFLDNIDRLEKEYRGQLKEMITKATEPHLKLV